MLARQRQPCSFAVRRLSLLPALLFVSACASPAVPPPPAEPASGAAPTGPTRVVIGVGADTPHLSTKLDPETGSFRYDVRFAVNSPLAIRDQQGATRPLLAAEIPSQERGSWTLNPDGTMATTWKIRPNALWHDGQPVTARDFSFALKVYQDPDVPVYQRAVEARIAQIDSVDEKSFVIHWKQIYLRADRLLTGELEPLPEHLVGALYESGDTSAFQNAPFWTSTAYVGTGPYRISEWEKGAYSLYRAFDGFFLGRPKIDEVVFQVVADQNAAIAQVLGGTLDFTSAQTLNTQAGLTVRQEWERTGQGQVLLTPAVLRQFWFQLDPSRVGQPALLDVRVRRAIAHAIDRAGLAEYVSGGASPVGDVMVIPSDPLFSRAQAAIARYPFDRGRALALLEEAGWTRRGDALVNTRGEPFTTEYWTSIASDNVTEMQVIANDLAQVGIQVSQNAYPQRSLTNEQEAQFPGFFFIPVRNMLVPEGLEEFTSAQCPKLERRFTGDNRACWASTEFDRLFRVATTTLNEGERSGPVLEALRLVSEELPVVPLSYNIEYVAVHKGLVGPVPRAVAQRGYTWNLHEWQWITGTTGGVSLSTGRST